MYGNGQSLSRDEIRLALGKLEEAVTVQLGQLDTGGGSELIAAAVRSHVEVMRKEVERLRVLLAGDGA